MFRVETVTTRTMSGNNSGISYLVFRETEELNAQVKSPIKKSTSSEKTVRGLRGWYDRYVPSFS